MQTEKKTIGCAIVVRKEGDKYKLFYDCKQPKQLAMELKALKNVKGGCLVLIHRQGDKVRVESRCGKASELEAILERF